MLTRFRVIKKANEIIFHRHFTSRNTKTLKFLPVPEPVTRAGGKTSKTAAATEIDQETLELLQRLSLVGFEKEEVVKIVQEAIAFSEKIFEVDTDKVKPLVSLLENEGVYLREDVPELDVTREDLLSNSKATQEHYFVSPIGNSEVKFDTPKPLLQEVGEN